MSIECPRPSCVIGSTRPNESVGAVRRCSRVPVVGRIIRVAQIIFFFNVSDSIIRMIVKSSYTFKVTPGVGNQKYQIEGFFLNQKYGTLEPLSASSQPTPKHMKIPFGAITSFAHIDQNVMEVFNKSGDVLQLTFDNLKPLLDSDDSLMKKALLSVHGKGIATMIKTLNALRESFEEVKDLSEDASLEEDCHSIQKCATVDSSSLSQASDIAPHSDFTTTPATQESISLLTTDCSKSPAIPSHSLASQVSVESLKMESVIEDDKIETTEKTMPTEKYIEAMIAKSEYILICMKDIEIPKKIKIDQQKVENLKIALQKTPDKTQTVVGLVRTVDGGGDRIKPYECWVNPELFLAEMELRMEQGPISDTERMVSSVNTVSVADGFDSSIVGSFLYENNKEFAQILHDRLLYQDLLKLACAAIRDDNSVETKNYLKSIFKSFAKGSKNGNFFVEFAELESRYIDKFEQFIKLYEEGSLNGQGISLRQMCRKDGKKKEAKLEIPINFLRLHLKVKPEERESCLDQILGGKITFAEYRIRLSNATQLKNVKKHVEKMTGQEISKLQTEHPETLSDEILSGFLQAKNQTTAQNPAYSRLAKHVRKATGDEDSNVNENNTSVDFCYTDSLSLLDISRQMAKFDTIVFDYGIDDTSKKSCEFSSMELVKKSSAVALFVNENEKELRAELSGCFDDDDNICVEFINVKRDSSITEDGFKKEMMAVGVVGRKTRFSDKEIKTNYNMKLKEAIPFVLADLMEVKQKVVIVSAHPFDVDPDGSLAKKRISVCYMASKAVLIPFAEAVDAFKFVKT